MSFRGEPFFGQDRFDQCANAVALLTSVWRCHRGAARQLRLLRPHTGCHRELPPRGHRGIRPGQRDLPSAGSRAGRHRCGRAGSVQGRWPEPGRGEPADGGGQSRSLAHRIGSAAAPGICLPGARCDPPHPGGRTAGPSPGRCARPRAPEPLLSDDGLPRRGVCPVRGADHRHLDDSPAALNGGGATGVPRPCFWPPGDDGAAACSTGRRRGRWPAP